MSSLHSTGSLGKSPTLAILSPYTAQVQRLRAAIGATNIATLEKLFKPEEGGDFFGTVDSFQGREADCVVISMVRNNEHSNYIKALGFLAESNRMNVLFSRAKHKLFIIGSMKFFEHVLDVPSNRSVDSLAFFKRLLKSIESGKNREILNGKSIPEVSVVPHDKFH